MKNKQLVLFLEGLLTTVVGVRIAVFGIQTVIDTYFGILFLITGVAFLGIECVALSKKNELSFANLFLGMACLLIGIFLLASILSFGILIGIFVTLVIAFGAALMFYGVYSLAKKETVAGVVQLVFGAVAVTMGILYLTVDDFAKAFWIVIGILVALYGAFLMVTALVKKK